MATESGKHEATRDRRALLRSRAGMLLDWSEVDKAMMLVAIPAPMLIGALFRVRFILGDPTDEPYLSRATLRFVVLALSFYLSAFALLGIVWRIIRRKHPSSRPFVWASLFLVFLTGSVSAYVVGHFSTPILGATVAGAMAVLLLFDLKTAMPMMVLGFFGLFGPIVPIAMRLIPYGPLYDAMPFVTRHPPHAWLFTTSAFGIGIVAAPTVILIVVVQRWRARDEEIHRLAKLDGLTEVPNRRYFLERLHEELYRVGRFGSTVSLILFDLDFFKRINDRHGHQVGDTVLVEVARLVQRSVVRRIDVVGRYGGEEFAVMLPGTDESGALVVAERLRAAIEGMVVEHGGTRISLTASFGVASYPHPAILDLDDFVSRADGALYRAKESGRNRVETEPLADRVSVPPLSVPTQSA